MGTRVRIMDMEVDLFTQETFQKEMTEYLNNDCLNVVHMISLDYIDDYDKNEMVQETLEQADMILPGEKAILSAHHVDVLETGGMIVDYRTFFEAIEPLNVADKTFYLVLRNKKEAKEVYRYMNRHFSKDCVIGVYVADGQMAEEALINDINTKLPDVIFLALSSTEQEEWLGNHKGKINAKLCMVAGSILPLIMRDNVHVPGWLKKIGLAGLYRFIVKIPNAHFLRKRIFHRKMDKYITKKKMEG